MFYSDRTSFQNTPDRIQHRTLAAGGVQRQARSSLVGETTQTRRDWWIGVVTIALALLAHAVIPQYVPRYEWRHDQSLAQG